jgi:hypothetical protein
MTPRRRAALSSRIVPVDGIADLTATEADALGRTDAREEILAASRVVAAVQIAQTAGVALARAKDVHAGFGNYLDSSIVRES